MTQQPGRFTPYPQPVAPPAANDQWRPARVDVLPGTGFALVQLQVPPISSGLATGSLLAGIGSILVSLLVFCFGLSGASSGWGGWVGGAFTLLAVLAGGGERSRSGWSRPGRSSGRPTRAGPASPAAAGPSPEFPAAVPERESHCWVWR